MTFNEIIARWPNATIMARALDKARNGSVLRPVSGNNVRSWRKRGFIPPARFPEVAAAAAEWGFDDITVPALNALYRSHEAAQTGATANVDIDASDFA